MNRVILMGRLTRDVEVRVAGNGETKVTNFSLAVDRRWKRDGEPNADFPNCIAFNKTAEFLEKYGKKGTKFVVEGRLQTGSYEKQDGTKVYTTDVVVDNVEFAESKTASENYDRLQREYEKKKIEELLKLAMTEEKREIKKVLREMRG